MTEFKITLFAHYRYVRATWGRFKSGDYEKADAAISDLLSKMREAHKTYRTLDSNLLSEEGVKEKTELAAIFGIEFKGQGW